MHHYRKTMEQYLNRKKVRVCPFCNPETLARAVYEDELVYIVPNLTKYDLWEMHDVEEHLLLIPKRHTLALNELTDDEKLAIMNEAARYERLGFGVYARGFGDVKRSVEHQHTHLIKTGSKGPRIAIYSTKPYYLLKW